MSATEAKSRRRFDPNDLRARDFLVIVPAIILFVIGGIAFASWVSHDVYIKWGGLTISTAVFFGYVVGTNQKHFRKPRFWIFTSLFITVHLLVWIAFLIHVEHWGPLGFNLMVFELPVFWYLRDWPGLLD